MPRYYFHVDNGELIPDLDGSDLHDVEAARHAAVVASAEALQDKPDFWHHSPIWRMYVTDEAHELVFSLSFSAKVSSGPVTFRPVGQ